MGAKIWCDSLDAFAGAAKEMIRTSFKKKKIRKCAIKTCRAEFEPRNISHKVCGKEECAIAWGLQEREKRLTKVAKEERIATRRQKEEKKDRADHLEDVQKLVNAIARKRDLKAGYGCISCGATSSYPRWQGGHFLSVGAHPQLRFNLDNIHLQCIYCNMHKSGNQGAFRAALIAKIGIERVEALECNQSSPKWTIPELVEMKKEFRRMLKEIENA